MTPPWWAAFGPAETRVACGAGQHLVRWSGGGLEAADHPDAEGELVLAALGGDATPCLDLVQAWATRSDDLSVLAIGPRTAEDTLTITPGVLEDLAGGTGWSGSAAVSWSSFGTARIRHVRGGTRPRPAAVAHLRPQGGGFTGAAGFGGPGSSFSAMRRRNPRARHAQAEESGRVELLALLALGTPLQWRLSGAVAHAWSADGQHASDSGRVGPALTAALAGRLAPAIARWLGVDAGQVEVTLHDEDGWGQIGLGRPGERRVRASLPVSWIARVWAPGLAVVGNHLVVSVEQAAWPQAQVLALPAPGRAPVELSVRHDGSGWSVTQ